MKTAPKPLIGLVQSLWTGDATVTAANVEAAIRADAYLTTLALQWVAEVLLFAAVDRNVRTVALKGGTAHMSNQFLHTVTERALSLLDVKFGAKLLGDYTPVEACAYADWLMSAAQTQAMRAQFVRAVAQRCPVKDKVIRRQISAVAVAQIRTTVLNVARKRGIEPDAELGGGAE